MAILNVYRGFDMSKYGINSGNSSNSSEPYHISISTSNHIQFVFDDTTNNITVDLYGLFAEPTIAIANKIELSSYGYRFMEMSDIHVNLLTDNASELFTTGLLGNDIITDSIQNDRLIGYSGNDKIYGNEGSDKLLGKDDNDYLYGGKGDDTLIGGNGRDVLIGGAGKDVFLFESSINEYDKIVDFKPVDDTIQLENSLFSKLKTTGDLNAAYFKVGTAAADSNDYLIYNKTTGDLYYDSDGNGASAAVKIAVIGADLSVTHADFTVI
jgi:Ca2+-binding RTX toxin-like protein